MRGALPSIIGRYLVLRLLGQGAMGRVLLARDTVLGREVAIKLLRDDLGLPPETRDALLVRMRHEAQAAARVSHPNLVTLHDMGDDAREGVYLVFEYVPGETLRDAIEGGALPPSRVARLARELGSALDAAHAAGVLHRDVKPENIMLAPFGAKIADFGIARIPDSTLTRTGSLVGTPAYCAPEALSLGQFSPAGDQFSLAATLYEAVYGERAFPGDDALTVAARIASEPPARLAARRGLDARVDEALLRAMSGDPLSRFPSCVAFTEALTEALGEGSLAGARGGERSLATGSRTGRAALGAVTAVGILVALVTNVIRGTSAAGSSPAFPSASALSSAAPSASAPSPRPAPAPARVRTPRAPVEDTDGNEDENADATPPSASSSALPPLPPPFADPFAPRPASSQTPAAPASNKPLVPPLGGMFQRGGSD